MATMRGLSSAVGPFITFTLLFIVSNAAKSKTDAPEQTYDFIFGYSTGHVGTTTLSEAKLYGSPANVQFLHEMKYGKFDPPAEAMNTEKWIKSTFEDQYNHVKNVYMPFMLKSRRKATTLLDLGHNVNYFAKALIKYLLEETTYKFIFVRLRRQRLEAAISLSYSHPDEPKKDLCRDLVTRFCPFDRPDEVILKPPSMKAWQGLSVLQQALWITDETEAQWIALKAAFPQMQSIEILWGKEWPDSMDNGALRVANLMGLTQIVQFDPTWDHMEQHQHAGDNSADSAALYQAALEDKAYQTAMKYSYQPG